MKKLLISFLLTITVLFSFVPYFSQAKAQTWYSQGLSEWYTKVYDQSISPPNEIFGERYTAAQVEWVIWSFLVFPLRAILVPVIGEDAILATIKALGTGTVDANNVLDGIKPIFQNTIDTVWNKMFNGQPMAYSNEPFLTQVFDVKNRGISGLGYTKNLFNKLSPVSTIKAQGIGYTGLTWVQSYWTGFRNIAYLLLVLITIVFAFMIMFRVKLNPQTVISVQSALPKVITAMILVTFSYAIAGFAIDLMYVITGLFALLLNLAGFTNNLSGAFKFMSGTAGVQEFFAGFWILFTMLAYFIMFAICAIWTILAMCISGINIFGMLIGVVFIFVAVWVLVLTIFYTFKVPYVLVKTLVSVYISIITAPIQILAGTIVPSMGFGQWFKKLIADILVFPVFGLVFWFAWATLWLAYSNLTYDLTLYWTNHVLFTLFGIGSTTPEAWIPEIIGSRGIGATSGITGIIFLSMSFGMIVLIPKIPDLLKQFLLGQKFNDGSDIGTMGTIAGYGGTGMNFFGNRRVAKLDNQISGLNTTDPNYARDFANLTAKKNKALKFAHLGENISSAGTSVSKIAH